MSFPPAQEHPVNFGDNPHDFPDVASGDAASIFTRHSGITAFEDTPRNTRGQTPAEEVLASYPRNHAVMRSESTVRTGYNRTSVSSTAPLTCAYFFPTPI